MSRSNVPSASKPSASILSMSGELLLLGFGHFGSIKALTVWLEKATALDHSDRSLSGYENWRPVFHL